jgi:hypothetical protein
MTDTAFDFSTVEVNEDAPTMPTDQDTLQCVVCGTPLTYGGRGPKPKYCADHKKNKTTGTGTRKTKRKTGTDYTAGVKGLIQVPAMALTMVGTSTKKPEYLADAFVLSHYADDIATAVSDIANDQPQIAAVLDKVLKVGPYGALMTAGGYSDYGES